MAYADAPFGFIPVRHRNGAPYNGAANPYWVDGSDSTALYIGDPVIIDGTANTSGLDIPGMGHFPAGTLPGVTRATSGDTNKITGVVVGVGADNRDSTVYREADVERVVWVADDPDLVFMAQVDEALATTAVGLNTNVLFTHAGSTSTARSGAEVDGTASADATKQLKIQRFVNDPENEANAVGNRVEVIINLHTEQPGVGQAGV